MSRLDDIDVRELSVEDVLLFNDSLDSIPILAVYYIAHKIKQSG